MQLDQLQLDLRPRSNAQALDLGFALLRANAAAVYTVWLMLWLPTIAICSVLAFNMPALGFWVNGTWLLLAWFVRPWLERAPLYMLSRLVFGEKVTWQETLRAWPSQLGGGFIRLFLLRPFAAGRGLYQAIWQLEGARKKSARYRIRVIGKHTAGSASWFGVACAHFEGIIQFGLFALIGFFLSDAEAMNPLSLFIEAGTEHNTVLLACSIIGLAISGGIIGPIYVACCFTLYLNRRATLEAWDLEIALRQFKPVVEKKSKPTNAISIMLLIGFLSAQLFNSKPVYADDIPALNFDKPICEREKLVFSNETQRTETNDPAIKQTRQELDLIYQDSDFQFYECKESWAPKVDKKKKNEKLDPATLERIKQIALALKYVFIALGIGFVIWLISRYRGQFFSFAQPKTVQFAAEVGGLDIRPETLPDDVAACALELWQKGERRAAIGLLYRASLARMVEQYQLTINQGATENDCLENARIALREARFSSKIFSTLDVCTNIWLRAAYAHQYPDSIAILCQQWRASFDQAHQGGLQ